MSELKTENELILKDDASQSFAGLPIGLLICQPILEVAKGQAALCQVYIQTIYQLAFVDGAVIVGTPFEARCEALVLISAPYDTSVARICARDGIAPEMARRRLDAQTPIETLRAAATHEVVNDGTAEQLAEKMHAVLQQL